MTRPMLVTPFKLVRRHNIGHSPHDNQLFSLGRYSKFFVDFTKNTFWDIDRVVPPQTEDGEGLRNGPRTNVCAALVTGNVGWVTKHVFLSPIL